MTIRLLMLGSVVALVVFGSLVGCRKAGMVDEVSTVGSALDDVIMRGATVGDDLVRQSASYDDLLPRSSVLDEILAGPATKVDDVMIQGVSVSSLGDEVARMTRATDEEGARFVQRIEANPTGALSPLREQLWRDLLDQVACLYLENRPADQVLEDVRRLLDRNSLVDTPEKRLELVRAASDISRHYVEMSDDDPLLYAVAVAAYCAPR